MIRHNMIKYILKRLKNIALSEEHVWEEIYRNWDFMEEISVFYMIYVKCIGCCNIGSIELYSKVKLRHTENLFI